MGPKLCNHHVNLTDIEDDSDYKVIIIWDPSSEHMAVFFDNESTPTIQMGFHLSNTFESGETFWGFTAGTGEKSNEQTVCITEVEIGNETVWTPTIASIVMKKFKSSNARILLQITLLISPILLMLVIVVRVLVCLVV